MPYKKCELPRYPLEADMWDKIANDPRPKVIYGMGNGADKLFSRLEKYNVDISEVFASDGFVRGHSFRGYKVRSFSEIKAKYPDFLILLSFASNRKEVIEMIKDIEKKHSLLIPDMPVAGEEYFDKNFYNEHYEEIVSAYESLSDDKSKNGFASLINYKLFGEADYLFSAFSDISEIYRLLPSKIDSSIDAGAYNGDTLRELLSYRDVKKIYAVEPDKRNYKKLCKYVEESGLSESVFPLNSAVWSSLSTGRFSESGNRNSSVDSTVSYESRMEDVPLITIDSIALDDKIDYIKLDVEGAEREALIGAENTINRSKPALLISAYHRSEDVFSLINYMSENHGEYKLYLRRTLCFPAWEIAIIATT